MSHITNQNQNQNVRKYGHIKSVKKSDDLHITFTDEHVQAFSLVPKVARVSTSTSALIFDLRTIVKLPHALSNIDQGSLGSCVANAVAYAYVFDEIKQNNEEVFLPSRLFIYYNGRWIEGTVDEDSGMQISDAVKSINKYGIVDEHLWIYDPLKFAVKPSTSIYTEAKKSKAVAYATIDFSKDKTINDRINHLKRTLQSGFPIVFGFTVYESFESDAVAKSGMVPMPQPNEQVMGGHGVCAVGFDDTKQCFIVKNSWGATWGLDGYFYLPYNYMADPNLADDFWVITKISNPNNISHFSPSDINPDAINLDKQPTSGGVVH